MARAVNMLLGERLEKWVDSFYISDAAVGEISKDHPYLVKMRKRKKEELRDLGFYTGR